MEYGSIGEMGIGKGALTGPALHHPGRVQKRGGDGLVPAFGHRQGVLVGTSRPRPVSLTSLNAPSLRPSSNSEA